MYNCLNNWEHCMCMASWVICRKIAVHPTFHPFVLNLEILAEKWKATNKFMHYEMNETMITDAVCVKIGVRVCAFGHRSFCKGWVYGYVYLYVKLWSINSIWMSYCCAVYCLTCWCLCVWGGSICILVSIHLTREFVYKIVIKYQYWMKYTFHHCIYSAK